MKFQFKRFANYIIRDNYPDFLSKKDTANYTNLKSEIFFFQNCLRICTLWWTTTDELTEDFTHFPKRCHRLILHCIAYQLVFQRAMEMVPEIGVTMTGKVASTASKFRMAQHEDYFHLFSITSCTILTFDHHRCFQLWWQHSGLNFFLCPTSKVSWFTIPGPQLHDHRPSTLWVYR